MSGNRFTQFKPQEHVSQYVPLPLELLAKIGEKKQNEIDVTKAKLDEFSSKLNIKAPIGLETVAANKEQYYSDKLSSVRDWFMANKGNTSGAAEKLAALGREYNSDRDVEILGKAYEENPNTLKKLQLSSEGKGFNDFTDEKGNVKQFGLEKGILKHPDGREFTSYTPSIYGYAGKGDWMKDATTITNQITEDIRNSIDTNENEIKNIGGVDYIVNKQTGSKEELITEEKIFKHLTPFLESLELDKGIGKIDQESFIGRYMAGIYKNEDGSFSREKLQADLTAVALLRGRKTIEESYNQKPLPKETNPDGTTKTGTDVTSDMLIIPVPETTDALVPLIEQAPDDKKAETMVSLISTKDEEGNYVPIIPQGAYKDQQYYNRFQREDVIKKIYEEKLKVYGDKADKLLPNEKDDIFKQAVQKEHEIAMYDREYNFIKDKIDEEFKGRNVTPVTSTRIIPNYKYIQAVSNVENSLIGLPASEINAARKKGLEAIPYNQTEVVTTKIPTPDSAAYEKRLNEEVQKKFGNVEGESHMGFVVFDETPIEKGGNKRHFQIAQATAAIASSGMDVVYDKGQKIEGFAGKLGEYFPDMKSGWFSDTLKDKLNKNPSLAKFNPAAIYADFNSDGTTSWMASGVYEVYGEDEKGDKTTLRSKNLSVDVTDLMSRELNSNELVQATMAGYINRELALIPDGQSSIIQVGNEKFKVSMGVSGKYVIDGKIAADKNGTVEVMSLWDYHKKEGGENFTVANTKAEAVDKIMEVAKTTAAFASSQAQNSGEIKSMDHGLFQVNDAAHTQNTQMKVWGKYVPPAQMTPEENVEYAVALRNKSKGWGDWTTYNKGLNVHYLNQLPLLSDKKSFLDKVRTTKFEDPKGGNFYLSEDVIQLVLDKFEPSDWKTALSIMIAESGGNKNTKPGINYKK